MAPKPPAALVRYLREERCALFCGAGLSAWAKLPTWKQLLQDIVKQLGDETPDDPHDREELSRLLEAGKLLEVADHCKEALGQRYNQILSERLRGATGEIPEPHKVIVQLPFAAVVTTNYDKLLERAYASVDNTPKAPTNRDIDTLGPLLFDGGFFILKAHGDIDRPDTMVLTTRDYQEIIHANAAFNSFFSALLLTKAVLFIGYSINDPDFRLLLDRQLTVFKGNIPERYALMTDVGKVERDGLWRTAKIRVIDYEGGKHEQVLEFLRTLLEQVRGESGTEAKAAAVPRASVLVPPAQLVEFVTPAAPPLTELSLRLGGQRIVASVMSGGNAVQGLGAELDWPGLARIIPEALSHELAARLFGQELSRRLPEVVLLALKDTPSDQTIVLLLSSELELLPWEWILVDGEFLVLRNPVVRAPIGVPDTVRGCPIVRQPARVLLIGDPNQDDAFPLAGSLAEVDEISEVYSRRSNVICDLRVGRAASFEKIAADLLSGRYDVVHFSGHAWFDELEPFLLLSRHVRLRSSEFRSLLSSRPPAILFLNSHYTIFTPAGVSREEESRSSDEPQKPVLQGQRGFIEAASTAGVGTLIGSFSGALDDNVARQVGVNFHKELLKGTPVARALNRALLASASESLLASAPKRNPSHLAYAMSGYGDIVLP